MGLREIHFPIGRTGGIPELVEEGVTGFLVEPGSVEDLEGAIVRLGDDLEKVTMMGLTARDRIRTMNSRDDYIERLMEIYRGAFGS